jgi:hypothetical protein
VRGVNWSGYGVKRRGARSWELGGAAKLWRLPFTIVLVLVVVLVLDRGV